MNSKLGLPLFTVSLFAMIVVIVGNVRGTDSEKQPVKITKITTDSCELSSVILLNDKGEERAYDFISKTELDSLLKK